MGVEVAETRPEGAGVSSSDKGPPLTSKREREILEVVSKQFVDSAPFPSAEFGDMDSSFSMPESPGFSRPSSNSSSSSSFSREPPRPFRGRVLGAPFGLSLLRPSILTLLSPRVAFASSSSSPSARGEEIEMGDSSPSCGERPLRWWDEEEESAAWWDEFPASWVEKSPPFSVGERAFKAPPFRADASEVDGRLGAAVEAWRSSTSTEKSSSS